MRARTYPCPECNKLLSPQGLSGHLRFVHHVGGEAKQPQPPTSGALAAPDATQLPEQPGGSPWGLVLVVIVAVALVAVVAFAMRYALVRCPHCRRPFWVASERTAAGNVVVCSKCGQATTFSD